MELKTFNAWGVVSIKANVVTVILSAVSPGGKPFHRTLKEDTTRPTDLEGTALIALNISEKGFDLGVHELDKVKIAEHPEVVRVLQKAVKWLKKLL
jgi:hypothetical protein